MNRKIIHLMKVLGEWREALARATTSKDIRFACRMIKNYESAILALGGNV